MCSLFLMSHHMSLYVVVTKYYVLCVVRKLLIVFKHVLTLFKVWFLFVYLQTAQLLLLVILLWYATLMTDPLSLWLFVTDNQCCGDFNHCQVQLILLCNGCNLWSLGCIYVQRVLVTEWQWIPQVDCESYPPFIIQS